MRLFIAIDFSRECKSYIQNIQKDVYGKLEEKGTIVPPENFHLTLAFLGEVEQKRLNNIKSAMNKIESKPFSIYLNGKISSFKRSREKEKIYFLQCDRSEDLESLERHLTQNLKDCDFKLEDRAFKAHITLFRRAYAKENLGSYDGFKEKVNEIVLMLSERRNGSMVYTPLYKKTLV